jgi:hypothetical protein
MEAYMTKTTMWMSGVGIAAASVLATAMVLSTGKSNGDGVPAPVEPDKPAHTDRTSLLDRLTHPTTRTLTVPAGTIIAVRLDQSLSTESNHSGESFSATLDGPLVISGKTVAPAGSSAEGKLTDVVDSGRVKGRASMTMVLSEIEINGKSYDLETAPRSFEAEATKKRDTGVIAGSAAIGAAIGAIAGGGKGAAIGAGVGGGAGTGAVLATKGKPVKFGPEARIRFTLTEPVQLPPVGTAAS